MKKIIAERTDIAFSLKLFPLKGHKDAYWKSKSIVCSKSVTLMEDNFAEKKIPKVDCNMTEIDDTIKFAEKNDITGTPTLIFSDGSVISGFIEADALLKKIDASSGRGATKKKVDIKKAQ